MDSSDSNSGSSPTLPIIQIKRDNELTAYTIGPVIGKGGFGVVHSLIRNTDGKQLAIKLVPIPKALSSNIKNEYLILTDISIHPNCHKYLICYYDIIKYKHNIGIIMEYVSNFTLKDYQNKNKNTMNLNGVLKYLKEILLVLSELHEAGIVHRDIKRENVLLIDGSIKLIDFGLARSTKLHSVDKYPIVGTPNAMAPELLKMKTELTFNICKSADIWAVGVMFYYIVTNHPPYIANNVKDLYTLILAGPPVLENISNPILNDAIRLCLIYDFNDRLSAKEIYDFIITKETV